MPNLIDELSDEKKVVCFECLADDKIPSSEQGFYSIGFYDRNNLPMPELYKRSIINSFNWEKSYHKVTGLLPASWINLEASCDFKWMMRKVYSIDAGKEEKTSQ